MPRFCPAACGLVLLLTATAAGQTVRTWTSNSDRRWNANGNWSGNNRADSSSEIAQFGTGDQLNPELNANNYTVRGLRFSANADGYDVGDDNGSRTLKLGSSSSGFIENLSNTDQVISIATLQFQSAATISTDGSGRLTLDSRLTGSNRNLTFDANGDINVTGNITTGSGTLTKQGAGNLNLGGSNTYTGQTSITAGAIVLQAADVFANSARVDLSAAGALRLNNLSDTIGRLTGSGTLDFGQAGTGRLTLGSGSSTFSGSIVGHGTLVIGAGASLTLGADFNNSDLNIVLDGGSLKLAGHDLAVGSLQISAASTIDFSAWLDSSLTVNDVGFAATGYLLTVQNWADAADYFYSHTGHTQGSAPLNQIGFASWSTSSTKWQSFDQQITPLPEPSAYGAVFLGIALVLAGGRAAARRAKTRA